MIEVLLGTLCLLVTGQIVAKFYIFKKVNIVLTRVERLLNINEVHSRLNQENKEKLKQALDIMKAETSVAAHKAESAAKEAKEEIKSTVEKVPEKVVEKIQESHDSKTGMKVYNPSKDQFPI